MSARSFVAELDGFGVVVACFGEAELFFAGHASEIMRAGKERSVGRGPLDGFGETVVGLFEFVGGHCLLRGFGCFVCLGREDQALEGGGCVFQLLFDGVGCEAQALAFGGGEVHGGDQGGHHSDGFRGPVRLIGLVSNYGVAADVGGDFFGGGIADHQDCPLSHGVCGADFIQHVEVHFRDVGPDYSGFTD